VSESSRASPGNAGHADPSNSAVGASRWGHTEQNQRAKFYRITAEGKKQLARDRSKWEKMVAAIGNILSPTPEG
jgi:hypothetical protein